jgi:opacity protein-like surface antigen
MKRIMTVLALAAFAAAPAAAQWLGMPVWNSPKGGTGVTINGDIGMPNSEWGKGTAFGARGSLGLANLMLTAGVSSWKPDIAGAESFTSIGGNAGFRVIGGSLLPIAINLQVGAATIGAANTVPSQTRLTAGGGVAVSVPTPGISIEPYLSITNRWSKASGVSGTESNVGWTLGANANLGMLGFHLAYDSESRGGATGGIFGFGMHVALKAPIGM